MAVNAGQLIDYAEALCNQTNPDELVLRTAAGKSYYAAFHDSCDWHAMLPAPGFLPAEFKGGTHVKLFHRLLNPDFTLSPEIKKMSKRRGIMLRALHVTRVQADYSIDEDFPAVSGFQSISNAKAICSIK